MGNLTVRALRAVLAVVLAGTVFVQAEMISALGDSAANALACAAVCARTTRQRGA